MVLYSQVFPDALFHQLLLAMSHTDYETRVEAHNVFSVLLLRTLLLPWSDQHKEEEVEESLKSDLRKDVNHTSHTSLSCESLDSLNDGGIKVWIITSLY